MNWPNDGGLYYTNGDNMSYSFSFMADSKEEAKQKIVESFDATAGQQPAHIDREAAINCGCAYVDTLIDPLENEEIHVLMSGSLAWKSAPGEPMEITAGSINVTVRITTKSR